MKEDCKICSVVYDLLPLFIEELTTEESNKLIEKHLKECETCNQVYLDMKEPICIQEVKSEPSKDSFEIFLRRISKQIKSARYIALFSIIINIILIIFIIIES